MQLIDDLLPEDEFAENPRRPTTDPNTLACTGNDGSSKLGAKYLEVANDFEDDDANLSPPAGWRHRYSRSTIECVLTTNLVDDEGLLRLYKYLCGAGENPDADDGGLPMVKLVKLWVSAIVGILIVHPLARWMVCYYQLINDVDSFHSSFFAFHRIYIIRRTVYHIRNGK